MTKRQKRLERIRQNPRNVSLEDFEAVINEYGHIEEGGKHPHAIIGSYPLFYKRQNPVKACYVLELLRMVDSIKEKKHK